MKEIREDFQSCYQGLCTLSTSELRALTCSLIVEVEMYRSLFDLIGDFIGSVPENRKTDITYKGHYPSYKDFYDKSCKNVSTD